MILLSSSDTPKYRQAATNYPDLFGWFITPRKRGIPTSIKTGQRWAWDNDCYNLGESFEIGAFLSWLETLKPYRESCLFGSCPDVVGNHKATLDRFMATYQNFADWPLAFVLQDGCQTQDVPWSLIQAVFVGGSTEYKLSQTVLQILIEAGQRKLWRHVGRVNSRKRINHFYGLADSFDGTGFSIEPDKKLNWAKNHLLWRKQQLSFSQETL